MQDETIRAATVLRRAPARLGMTRAQVVIIPNAAAATSIGLTKWT